MTALVVRGDALHLPLRDNSVDLIVTSPPYFALRAYQTGHEMEVGSEATPQAYLEALWAATREMKRVLRPSGSIWINLGDKYSDRTGGKHRSSDGYVSRGEQAGILPQTRGPLEKSLLGLPWRYAIGCIDHLNLILRAEEIWSKPNGLPESVTDRVRRSHETWFHFTVQPRYFAALDEIREPHARSWTPGRNGGKARQSLGGTMAGLPDAPAHPLGALPGSVWSIPSEPLRLPPWVDTQHYAAFPSEWPRRLILGFTPHVICDVCGVGRFPIVDKEYEQRSSLRQTSSTFTRRRATGVPQEISGRTRPQDMPGGRQYAWASIVGYGCACTPFTDHPGTGEPHPNGGNNRAPERLDAYPVGGIKQVPRIGPWREYHLDRWTPPPGHPATVLDPFGGTGTVAHVAHALGRHAITIDLSEAYCRLATDQTLARQRAAKVFGRVHQERQLTLDLASNPEPRDPNGEWARVDDEDILLSPFSVLNLFPKEGA